MEVIVLYSLAAIFVGILVGLLPSLPVFLAPLLMLPFAYSISTEAMLMVWMLSVIGSQFFGSVAVITTRIPGEENTLVYINDLDRLTASEKIALIRDTAFGSMIAGLISAMVLFVGFHTVSVDVGFFSKAWVQGLVYSVLLVSFVLTDRARWAWSLLLMAVGVILSTKNNYALPSWWIDIQSLFADKTLFMMTLGLLIVPSLWDKVNPGDQTITASPKTMKSRPWAASVAGSVIGFVAGLIPGPSAYTGSFVAYRFFSNIKNKIVSAEAANNSAVIATALPFLLTAIPINQNTLLLGAALDLNRVEINHAIWQMGSFGLTLIDQLIVAVAASSVLFYYLSTHFISAYVKVIHFFHDRAAWVLATILGAMCVLDVNTSNSDVINYAVLTGVFSLIGLALHRYRINPLPFLFACIIGDRMVWCFLQLWRIYL